MRRREFFALLGGAAVGWPLTARAQQPTMPVIGFLHALSGTSYLDGLRQGLADRGFVEGRNVTIEYRWAEGHNDRLPVLAKELVSLAPNAIVVQGSPAVAALRQETQSIPIVFVNTTDPVGQGFVTSLAHPGGNITGFSDFDPEMGSKWLELLKEIAPGIARVAVIFNPTTAPSAASFLRSIEAAAPAFAVSVTAAPVHDAPDIERAITLRRLDRGS
jgi:putative tryptophan/tyrosine transport system substrate-binding protein